MITIEQSHAVMATLAQNVDWNKVDMTLLQDSLIRNPKNAGAQFTQFLANGAKTGVVLKRFPIWKTIKLGTGLKTANDFRNSIQSAGYEIGDKANNVLDGRAFKTRANYTEVDLVNVSLKDLGFRMEAEQADIYQRVFCFGLKLCSVEVALQLCSQYLDQPKDDWVWIGMKPLPDSSGNPNIFYVAHLKEGKHLGANGATPTHLRVAQGRWVFVLPRKKAISS